MAKKTVNHPKDPFNAAAQTPEVEIVFESDFDDTLSDEDENTLRGNTDPKHDPKNIKNPGLTPPGTPSMFGKPRNQGQEPPKKDEPIRGQPADKNRQEELLKGDFSLEEDFNGFRVRTKLADNPSRSGILGGRIEEMVVTEGEHGNETELAHFKDGDWVLPPETTPVRQSISDAVNEYDPECMKSKSAADDMENDNGNEVDKDAGKKNGHSR